MSEGSLNKVQQNIRLMDEPIKSRILWTWYYIAEGSTRRVPVLSRRHPYLWAALHQMQALVGKMR
jgi:hypothetical protein